ncbi:hypothetical protein PGT21_036231 [Puccinia graminis f. sp. tritici]|uniref:Fanconi-associated nuclease n=1 Tax=Puccinia graminis f. sp. tritici TaxID=56615 RepID=A0A5B0P184_PUCGR|nr:hypothetical protein PGT21_036231 [Puccinia graminis f. sp. tritici]KAA1121430.1 hypothetical protein PGTUg99_024909 [Puccinia graminis f. sp. tritici]
MSSPPTVILDSSSSSSSDSSEHSDHPSPAKSSKKLSKRKKNQKNNNKPKDKFLITADQWTPIAGPSVPKPNKHQNNHPQETLSLIEPTTNTKLVSLFEPSTSSSSARTATEDLLLAQSNDQEAQQPILVTVEQRVSLYVNCFEEMLNIVLRHEDFLFLPSELRILNSWQALPRSSKYLFVRLFMRKHENWFRLDKLSSYEADVGDLGQTCGSLCKPVDELLAELTRMDPLITSLNNNHCRGGMENIEYPGDQSASHLGGPLNMSTQLEEFNHQYATGGGLNDIHYAGHQLNNYSPCQGTNDPQYPAHQLNPYSPSQAFNNLPYAGYQINTYNSPGLGINDVQYTGHQLNLFNPSEGISNAHYTGQQHGIPVTGLFRHSPPAKLDQLNPYNNPYEAINNVQFTSQAHGTHLDGFLKSSPPAKFDPLNLPQHSPNGGMDDAQYSGEQPGISFSDLIRSSPAVEPDHLTTFNHYEGMNDIQWATQQPVSLDELLQCNTHDLAMLEGPYSGALQDTELAYQDQLKSFNQLSPTIPSRIQLGDPSTCPDSPADSLKTDEGIIAQLNVFLDQTSRTKNWTQPPANTLSSHLDQAPNSCRVDESPGPEWIPFDVNDSQILPDIPPIPPPVDIRPTSITKPPDLVSTTPSVSPSRSQPVESGKDPELSSFATMTSSVDYGLLNTDDLFACMNLDELKSFAKKLNANPHTTRDMIILSIKAVTCKQSTLFGAPSTNKGKQRKQLSLKFTKKGLKESQILSLNSRILKIIGPSIKLRPKVCSLFKRLHLIFYRSTTITEKTMTASMLAQMRIRNYPTYTVIRTNSIFDSREQLMKYEEALELEKQFDDLMVNERRPWNEDDQGKARRQEAKTVRLKKALDVFESAWLLWQAVILEENDRLDNRLNQGLIYPEYDRSNYYKRRFQPGWPLTRILQKGLAILARFKEYEREVKVLEALIQQPHFRRGKRGQWYDRLALVLMTHLARDESLTVEQRQIHMNSALYTCEHGLKDPDTHQLYRFSLGRRLARLQAIGGALQHPWMNSLEPTQVEDWKTARRTTIHRTMDNDDRESGVKSRWMSILDNTLLSVEEIALEHYLSDHPHWRGFHSETGILKMIFSLVFWDVIFAPVPGAFETAFQTAPLDIATDAFAIVRRPLIDERMGKIEGGGSEEIVNRMRETYVRESGRKTWSIGISQGYWERYRLEDLEQIVRCFSAQAFILISNALFEDYSVWSAGAPDLCLWDPSQMRCKFVEVKGPGDKLSEQQKNWLSLLLKAEGIEVEICSVKED